MARPKRVYDPFDGSFDTRRSTEPERSYTPDEVDAPFGDHTFVTQDESLTDALGLAHQINRLGSSSVTIRGTRLA